MIKGIKHIIFDLGGVILNIDYQLTSKAFKQLGVNNFDELYSQKEQIQLFDELETGKIDNTAFFDRFNVLLNTSLSHQQIEVAWNAMLLDWPIRRLQILQQLQNQFDLFLLSNTNSIHEAAFTKSLEQTHGLSSIALFFDKAYFSHRLGLRKPDTRTFEHILQKHQLNPSKTLFIDDSIQHINAADSIGIKTIFLDKGMTIEKDIFKPIS
jgi:putative hydrolase of the HAD superfamily